jgi:hypothetical protein
MMKFLNRIGEALKAITAPSLDSWQIEQRQRESRAKMLIATITPGSRTRFADYVLAPLLDAGWHEGRQWDSKQMETFMGRFHSEFPVAARAILVEFGGLEIGFRNRTIVFGSIEDELCVSQSILPRLLPGRLFPLGHTNIFEDDGLGVLVDAAGQVYVDGATGYDPPKDYRLDLISPHIDVFLASLFSDKVIPQQTSWYYSLAETT